MLKMKVKLKEYEKVTKEIEKLVIEYAGNDSIIAELLILKARIMEKVNNYNEAAINYEQAAKYGSSQTTALALFKLAKFRARQKDYYEALFNIKRIQSKSISKKIRIFTHFIDGVTSSLMSRSFLS